MEKVNLVEKSAYYWEEDPITDIKNNNLNNRYKMVDLCCGAGGLSKGFEMTGQFEVILGVDIFTSAMETFKLNHPETSSILGDVRKVTNEMYQNALGNNHINLVTAGVPCQGFSLSNKKRNEKDERNFLFLEVIRFVNLFNPDVVLIENVSGMQSLAKGAFVKEIETALTHAGEGYRVKYALLNAADYGVPQLRKRLIFIAVKNSMPEFNFPEPRFGDGLQPYNTIRDAIGDLPLILAGQESNVYLSEPQCEYQSLMRENSRGLFNHKAPKHPQETIDKIAATLPGEPMYENYKQRIRLDWNIQSPTQLAGGIRPQFQFGHPEVSRGLTIRERARIQSFPDDYIFTGGVVQGRVQTGNAVPPLLARAVGYQVAALLDEHELNQRLFEQRQVV